MWNTFSKQKGIVYAKVHSDSNTFRRLPVFFFIRIKYIMRVDLSINFIYETVVLYDHDRRFKLRQKWNISILMKVASEIEMNRR